MEWLLHHAINHQERFDFLLTRPRLAFKFYLTQAGSKSTELLYMHVGLKRSTAK